MNRVPQIVLALVLLMPGLGTAADVQELRYSGSLTQTVRGGEELILRQFEVLALLAQKELFFSVLDDERNGAPWPESFGRFQHGQTPRPHLMFEYDGNTYTHDLPVLQIDLPENVDADSTWTVGQWTYESPEKQTVDGAAAWKIRARERRGRRQTLVVAAETGLLISASLEVFMGQGDKFQLTIKQTSVADLSAQQTATLDQLQSELLALQASLGRRPDTQLASLSGRQVEESASRLDSLSALAKNTPLQEFVLRIRRDVERQQQRVAQTMKRKQELVGDAAPEFSLNLVTGGTLDSAALKGRVVILHFWNYSEKPLSEPYGQVGYLDFLFTKLKSSDVRVVGVATNQSFQQADQKRAGIRTARKLMEFMNLSYPVGYDNGSLLRELGDPRDGNGELPLWVVISPAGKVVHYHAGFYEVHSRQGLKELSDAVAAQLPVAAKAP